MKEDEYAISRASQRWTCGSCSRTNNWSVQEVRGNCQLKFAAYCGCGEAAPPAVRFERFSEKGDPRLNETVEGRPLPQKKTVEEIRQRLGLEPRAPRADGNLMLLELAKWKKLHDPWWYKALGWFTRLWKE